MKLTWKLIPSYVKAVNDFENQQIEKNPILKERFKKLPQYREAYRENLAQEFQDSLSQITKYLGRDANLENIKKADKIASSFVKIPKFNGDILLNKPSPFIHRSEEKTGKIYKKLQAALNFKPQNNNE